MLNNMDRINNVIFDLGGVILDIDLLKGMTAMKQLGITNFESSNEKVNHMKTFMDFEKGLLSEAGFIEKLKEENEADFSNDDFIDAWNEIIVGFQQERIDLIANLKKSARFRTFLLSNTNSLHKDVYTRILREEHSVGGLEELFDKAYFSHEIYMRKPDPVIYHYVLNTEGLIPEQTLFIDDSLANIETARSLGMETFHLSDGVTINDLFSEQQVARWI